jgi:3-deoxy-D-manno-octulosonate 8-phosphate phosphatase (KDO 8-P phosphatase)
MLVSRAKLVRAVAFDVDGVMTDGGLYLTDSGEEFKRFHSLDGKGIKMLLDSGIAVAIITGRTSNCVTLRAQNLGITQVYQGVEDKWTAMLDFLESHRLTRDAGAFMGDDIMDLRAMRHVGLAISVPDAPQRVRDDAHYITQRRGGHGAVREACELILSAQNLLDAQFAPYL